jgi:hypothetical protein
MDTIISFFIDAWVCYESEGYYAKAHKKKVLLTFKYQLQYQN